MRSFLLLGVVCGLLLAAIGCGSSDSGGSSTTASSASSAPPPPPSAPSAPPAPSAGSSAPGSSAPGSSDAASGYPMPGGSASAGYPMPGGSSSAGYPGASSAPGYPGGSSSAGYPMPGSSPGEGSPPNYPAGYPNPGADAASGYPGAPSGYPGSPNGAGGLAAAKPPRPKTLREKAVDAFRDGKSDEGVQLLSAYYLTNPTAGPELGRVMQWSPSLHKPTLVTRIGIAVVYASQPPTFDGHPQPIGSPELDASLASMEQKGDGGNREGGNPRVGGGIRRGGRGGEGNPGAAMPPGAPGGEGSSGYGSGGGQNALPTSPQEELAYFTGEVGTKLVAKIKTKLEAGDFGSIYRDALKAVPLAKNLQNQEGQSGYGRMMPPGAGEGRSGPPNDGGGVGPPGAFRQPGTEGGEDGKGGGVITGQLIPGVEFLGAAQNIKELGDLVKAASVDAVIFFEVRVRPATANSFVNNDTKFRLVSAAEMGKPLFQSAALNNKQVHEARKKRGAEDPVAKEIDNVLAALETNFKLVPLPALSPEQAMKRLTYLLELKPEDATPLLLEARLFVTKKLVKPDDVVTLALTAVSEEQLAALGEVVEDTDLKGQIGIALSGKNPDAPTTVLGKFGAALSGAGGLGNLVPAPQLPPVGLPAALPPGGYPQPGAGGYPRSGPPAGYPQSGPPSGFPQPAGSAPPMNP